MTGAEFDPLPAAVFTLALVIALATLFVVAFVYWMLGGRVRRDRSSLARWEQAREALRKRGTS